MSRAGVRLAVVLAAAALAACAATPASPDGAADLETRCEAWFAAVDAIVREAGVGDAEAARVAGFPHLRTDRFLASWRIELSDDALRAWTDAMLRLDREARAIELGNLPPADYRRVVAAAPRVGLMDVPPAIHIEGCGKVLRERDLADPARSVQLREAAVVPDDYATWKRAVGFYWITRVPFAMGVRGYEAGVMATFAASPEARRAQGTIVRYAIPETLVVPPTVAREAAARVAQAGARFESPEHADVRDLLAAHAPIFEVDEVLTADRIGFVRRAADGAAQVDTVQAIVYARVAFTRFDGRVLTQLVYTAWLPGRPKTSAFDTLGGDWDAIVWRVTLDVDANPLAFDTMHACGCYHMFFPTPRLALRPRPDTLDEWALVPQRLPDIATGERVRLRIASRTHYVERVSVGDAPADRRYGLVSDAELRALAFADGTRRSLYGPDGIVPGSERGERYFFWPMGIAEPGAMRQWGRHATAFVGRRHFDDADLLDRYFTRP